MYTDIGIYLSDPAYSGRTNQVYKAPVFPLVSGSSAANIIYYDELVHVT